MTTSKITIVRDRVLVRGDRPDRKTKKPTSGESGRIVVDSWYGAIIERLDGRVRLPNGVYNAEMRYMRDGKTRAICFRSTTPEVLEAMGPNCRESFEDARIYIHGVRGPTAFEQLEGCVGVVGASILYLILGGWVAGRKFTVEIVDGGLTR